jgi:hypothetical protein
VPDEDDSAGIAWFSGQNREARSLSGNEKTRFQEIDVERINVVDEDGKVRMAILGTSRSAGWVIRGKPLPSRPKHAGIIFYNDDGEECGGLIFGNGRGDGHRSYGLTIWDRPETPMAVMVEKFAPVMAMPDGPEKKAAMAALKKEFPAPERTFVGRRPDGSTVIEMSDTQGRKRIYLSVGPDDVPRIEALDENGKVTWSLPPEVAQR